jgi:hypothetical protein
VFEIPFRCSSVVEQCAVNALVAGSNPAAGADNKTDLPRGLFCYRLRAEEAICMASERIRKIGDVSSAKPPITRRQREIPAAGICMSE